MLKLKHRHLIDKSILGAKQLIAKINSTAMPTAEKLKDAKDSFEDSNDNSYEDFLTRKIVVMQKRYKNK